MFGYNYTPSRQGCNYWSIWDFSEIEEDLIALSNSGSKLIRFFLFWRDFEPAEGVYDEVKFERLKQLVRTCNELGLLCIPSLLTVWMNGQRFDLDWRAGRCYWSNPVMLARGAAFSGKVSAALSSYPNIFAYDIADEMTDAYPREARRLSEAAANSWLSAVKTAIVAESPASKTMMAHNHTALTGESPFHAELSSKHVDYIAIHGFPNWAPVTIESNDSFRSSLYIPFLVKLAHSYGTPFVDEFGNYGCSESIREGYVRSAATSSLLNGAGGIVSWCWKDIEAEGTPYREHPYERTVGFHDSHNIPKPSAGVLLDVHRQMNAICNMSPLPPETAIYIPERDRPSWRASSNRESTRSLQALFAASLLLTRLHIPHCFTLNPSEKFKFLVKPGASPVTQHDMEVLSRFVNEGGTLLFTSSGELGDYALSDLFGIELNDFTFQREDCNTINFHNVSMQVVWPTRQIPVIQANGASILARYECSGHPALTVFPSGKGKAYYANIPIEKSLETPGAFETEQIHSLYAEAFQASGVSLPARFSSPDVELLVFQDATHYAFVLINHSNRDVNGELLIGNDKCSIVQVGKKSSTIIKKQRARCW